MLLTDVELESSPLNPTSRAPTPLPMIGTYEYPTHSTRGRLSRMRDQGQSAKSIHKLEQLARSPIGTPQSVQQLESEINHQFHLCISNHWSCMNERVDLARPDCTHRPRSCCLYSICQSYLISFQHDIVPREVLLNKTMLSQKVFTYISPRDSATARQARF